MKILKSSLDDLQIKYLKLKNYNPKKGTYKILKKDYEILNVIKKINNIINKNEITIIGIDGMSGSGKSTIGLLLSKVFDANLYHIDDFFQPPKINPNDKNSYYGSNINFNKIKKDILSKINNNEDITYEPFDFKTHKHLSAVKIKANKINIIEGSYSMHPELFDNYHYTLYFKINRVKQLFRIIKRSGFKRTRKFLKTWIPNELKYNKDLLIENKANIIIKM